MNANMVITQSVSEGRMMLRRREVVFFSVLLPVMFMLLFGSIFGHIKDGSGIAVINYLLPGYVVMAVMSVSFISLGIMTANERQNSILKRLGATPLPRAVLILGKIVAIALIRERRFAAAHWKGSAFPARFSLKGSERLCLELTSRGIASTSDSYRHGKP